MDEWKSVDDGLPPDGTWCWVWNGSGAFPALRDSKWAGGWTNEDCWEDFDGCVTHYCPIRMPDGTPYSPDA